MPEVLWRLPVAYCFMLLDELAYDWHLSSQSAKPKSDRGIDVEDIRQKRILLEQGRNFQRYVDETEGSLTAARDADWYAARLGDTMGVVTGSRHESTFFHPTKPPPNGVDGHPLRPPA